MITVDDDQLPRYQALCTDLSRQIEQWQKSLPGLADAQQRLSVSCNENNYALETPFVYNKDLNLITAGSRLGWIIIADNPGKKEQLAINNRYLVGTSGRAAENFFNKELKTDFRTETIIINKTPLHTPKTAQLKKLVQIYPEVKPVLEESQLYMARFALKLYEIFHIPLWLMGLSEVRSGGIFSTWYHEIRPAVLKNIPLYTYNHFSMGSFSRDLNQRRQTQEPVLEAVLRIGQENTKRCFKC